MGRHRTCSSLVVIFAFPPRLLMLTVCLGTLWLSVGGAGVTDSFSQTASHGARLGYRRGRMQDVVWSRGQRVFNFLPMDCSSGCTCSCIHFGSTRTFASASRIFSVNYNCFSSSGSHGFSLPKPHQRLVRRVVEAKRELTTCSSSSGSQGFLCELVIADMVHAWVIDLGVNKTCAFGP